MASSIPCWCLRVGAAVGILCWGVPSALAQDRPPPTLTTLPSPPPANQAFSAVYSVHTYANAFGFSTLGGPPPAIQVTGNTILVPFSHGCGFICQPGLVLRSFPFQMPPLPAGTYTVLFNPSTVFAAEFELVVGGGIDSATPVPGPSPVVLMLLAAAILLLAGFRLRQGSYISEEPPGNS